MEWIRAQIVQHYRGKGFCGGRWRSFCKSETTSGSSTSTQILDLLSGKTPHAIACGDIDINEKPKAVINCPEIPVRVSDIQGTCQGDAFARNQKDLAPFVRSLEGSIEHFQNFKMPWIICMTTNCSPEIGVTMKMVVPKESVRSLHHWLKVLTLNFWKPETASLLNCRRGCWWFSESFLQRHDCKCCQSSGIRSHNTDGSSAAFECSSGIHRYISVSCRFLLYHDPLENKAVPTDRFKRFGRWSKAERHGIRPTIRLSVVGWIEWVCSTSLIQIMTPIKHGVG